MDNKTVMMKMKNLHTSIQMFITHKIRQINLTKTNTRTSVPWITIHQTPHLNLTKTNTRTSDQWITIHRILHQTTKVIKTNNKTIIFLKIKDNPEIFDKKISIHENHITHCARKMKWAFVKFGDTKQIFDNLII